MGAVVVEATEVSWRAAAEQAVRRLAAMTVGGALAGVLVGGVGGRLAMMLLAAVNPDAAGVTSDDGFTIGQLTLSGSVQLLGAALQLGLIGAAVYTLLRGLLIGPRWFQVLSISVGPAVVVGTQLVHSDGVDFTLLQPLWLTIGLFLLIPALFAACLTLLAERWMRPGGWSSRASLGLVIATLVLWVPVLPLLPLLVVAWLVAELLRRVAVLEPWVSGPALRWAARGGLGVVFVVAAVDLGRKVVVLA
ncbi:MAG TPA: hypothetical protein VFJ14_14060 [Nocardioidaceae bacterium]|nr:hypothetical protein [Nocardioidaceae bacterium]